MVSKSVSEKMFSKFEIEMSKTKNEFTSCYLLAFIVVSLFSKFYASLEKPRIFKKIREFYFKKCEELKYKQTVRSSDAKN